MLLRFHMRPWTKIHMFLKSPKGQCKWGNIAAETFWVNVVYESANWKEAKDICFRDSYSTSSKCVAWVRKQGNIQKTIKVSVSSVFPKWLLVCCPTQHLLKTQNQCPESKKCFWNFPKTFFCVLDAFLLLQQRFLVCGRLKRLINLHVLLSYLARQFFELHLERGNSHHKFW